MLPFDNSKAIHAQKSSQYSNDFEQSSKSDIPGFSKKILSAIRSLLPKEWGTHKVPRVE